MPRCGLIVNGDAHCLAEIGARTRVHVAEATVSELRLALDEQQGRHVELVSPWK